MSVAAAGVAPSAADGTVPLEGAARAAWERALALWGVRMHDAELRPGAGDAQGAPAWFSFPPEVVVDPAMVERMGGGDELESVFAHELGHHALAPGTRLDSLKIRHQMARALVAAGAERIDPGHAAHLSNLWTDLLVNTRVGLLQRRRDGPVEPGIVRLSRALFAGSRGEDDRLWWVYLRTCELLWNLPPDTLCVEEPPPPASVTVTAREREVPIESLPERHREKEIALRRARRERERIAAELSGVVITAPAFDADELARLVRTFADDPVGGALQFGVLAAPYILERPRPRAEQPGAGVGVTACAADHAPPTTAELGQVLADRRLSGGVPPRFGAASDSGSGPRGQGLDVARTLQLYPTAAPSDVLAAWYRAQAAPWIRPIVERRPSLPVADLPGPLEVWEPGDDVAAIDWSSTLQAGPVVIPGVTTRRRSFLEDEPARRGRAVDLDIIIDSSGSMPHPMRGSPAVLAGTILALSVLRGGGRVRTTSFAGAGQVAGSEDFSRDHVAAVGGLAHYFAGGTSFPLDVLGRRYAPLPPPKDPVTRHLVVLSDDGLTSMFGDGNEPFAGVAAAVRTKLTTATLVLLSWGRRVEPLAHAAGYDTVLIESMDDAPRVCARLAEVLRG